MKNTLYTLALLLSFSSFGQTAEEYYEKAQEKSINKDYYGAIADLTKAAELGMEFAYFKRGAAKQDLGDDEGALKDYTVFINKGGTYVWAFRSRAGIYYDKGMFQEALEDYLTSISVDPSEEYVNHPYYSIGLCRAALEDMDGACKDWKKASSLGNKEASKMLIKYCN